MGTYSPHRLAVLWAALQLSAPSSAPPRRTRRESATRTSSPAPAHARSGPARGRAPARRRARWRTSANTVSHLTPSHGVAGSRTRFTAGRIELELDDAWRSSLPAGARRVVTAVTLPQLRRLRVRRTPTARRTDRGRLMAIAHRVLLARPAPAAARGPRFLKPGWPLAVLYLGFPLWWALGLAQIIFFAMAAAMAVILRKQTARSRCPRGFSPLAAVPDLDDGRGPHGAGPARRGPSPAAASAGVAGFGVWAGWYLAITIAMLYVANTARQVPTQRIVRLLGWMFVVTAGFGVLAVLAPTLEFESPMEMVLPKQLVSTNFVRTLVHPSLASSSDFLGYVQPRPTAPFPYSNAWGNNLALYLPFFILAWFGQDAGWRKKLARWCWSRAIFPIIFSLNRGLWISLALAAVYAAIRLAVNGRGRALQTLLAAAGHRRHRVRVLAALRHARAAGRDPAQQRPPRRHRGDGHLGRRRGVPVRGLRHHPHHAGQLQLPGRRRDRGVPPVRRAAARDPGLHVAAGPHHRLRRHRALPGVLRLPVPAPGARAVPAGRRGCTVCSSQCSASSSTTPSGRRCSPR